MAKSGSSDGRPKSNLGLILGIAAGAVFLCCCIPGIGGPATWYFLRLKPATVAKVDDKEKDKDNDKDKEKDKDKDAKIKPGDGRAKKLYEQVALGMHADQVEKITGGRGVRLLMSKLPRLEDKKLDANLSRELRDNQINPLFEWREPDTDDRFVVGYREDITAFKAHYYGPDGKAQLIHDLSPAGKK